MERILFGAMTVLGACTPASSTEDPGSGDAKTAPQGDAKQTPPGSWTEAARTHLVLGKHTPEAKAARFVAVALEGRKVSDATEFDAVPLENWPDHFASVAAHGGGARFVTQRAAADGVELVVHDWGGTPSSVKLPKGAAAMHMVGDQVLVGIEGSVYWIDLRKPGADPELLVARPMQGGKAYDLFVRRDAWVFAIDDIVRPIYADSFRLQAEGTPAHDKAFELPSMINGSYYAGALEPSGADAGTIYLLGQYGIMDGSGHDLAALPIEGGKTKHDGALVLNSTASTDPPVLEEHVDRGSGKPSKIVAGTEVTAWTGVELVGDGDGRRILLPAGARGLLAIPPKFTPQTKAEVVFAEPVVDAKVDGARVFVLTGKQLVELKWGVPKPEEVGRVELPDSFDRIVD